jgi:hypothetical protein
VWLHSSIRRNRIVTGTLRVNKIKLKNSCDKAMNRHATPPAIFSAKPPGKALLLAVALFVLTRLYLLAVLEPMLSDVGEVYFDYAARAIDFGQTPYQGEFTVEYPPLAWWTIAAPRLVDARRITDPRDPVQLGQVFTLYRSLFRSLMFLCDLLSFLLLLLIVQNRRRAWTAWAALAYTLSTAILGHLLYDRLDIVLLMLLMVWAYCWLRGADAFAESHFLQSQRNPDGESIAWLTASYAALGLSIGFKLIPILCAAFLLLVEWHAPARWKRLGLALAALASTAVLPFAIQYAVSGPAVLSIFSYHGQRGIQIESLYATLMMIAAPLGAPVFISHSHGAYELDGFLAPAMRILSMVALSGFLIGAGIWAVVQKSQFTRQTAYRVACFVPAAAMILANVLSPQYFIWALPLLILVGAEVLPATQLRRWIFPATVILVAGLTTWIFPYHYFQQPTTPSGLVALGMAEGATPGAAASAILGLRNAIYLAILCWLGRWLFDARKTSSSGRSPQVG